MKQILLIGLVLFASLQIACTRERESTTQAAGEPAMTNSDLEKQIQAKIDSDPWLREAKLSITADAERNRATLSGKVETEALRTKAVELAKSAHPGLIVENRIDLKPRELSRAEYTEEHARQERENARVNRETIGSSLDDAWIHAKIVGRLIADMNVSERKINVDVDNSVVTLRGTVETARQKSEAERIAKETDGVKRVINQLKVQG